MKGYLGHTFWLKDSCSLVPRLFVEAQAEEGVAKEPEDEAKDSCSNQELLRKTK